MLTPRQTRSQDERGAVTVLFALMLPLFMIMGSLVITVASWYTHARQLQTKVDAGALAAGGVWSFPCAPEVDLRIRDTARLYVGDHMAADGATITGSFNAQVGGVEGDQIFVTMNQGDWWDDAFPGGDFTDPAGSVCERKTLDVKATENDSPLLWGWLPFMPDIKRKARVEIEGAPGMEGVLPVAVRVPRPVASAAVIYDESNGNILAARYFEDEQDVTGLPAGLDGYSTRESGDPALIPSLPSRTGVVVALSFRPACGTPDTVPPCFDVEGFASVHALCNQGTGTQIVKCYHTSGRWPTESAQSGLHFLRGYVGGNVGNGPPQLRGAYLENSDCEANGYFNSLPSTTCRARLKVDVDLGSVFENVGGGGDDDDDDDDDDGGGPEQTRKASNVEVRYRLVRSDGTSFCDYGISCELFASDPEATGGNVTYSTQGGGDSPHLPLTGSSRANAIAIQIRVRHSTVRPNPGNCGVGADFNNNCRWFHRGSGPPNPSVEPSESQILASPVQRAFMGNLDLSGPVKWLRIGKDVNCNREAEIVDGAAATHPTGSPACFFVDMGLKGGMARDQDEPPFAFNEGSGPSQMGSVDCDPAIQQGQALIEGVVNGCHPHYAANRFDTNPLCPPPEQFFNLPKPPPFDDWMPIDCIKTRPTGSMNQLLEGLNLRIFGDRTNPSCPPDRVGYVRGRNYWHRANNLYDSVNFAWDRDTPMSEADDMGNNIRLDDPRLVTLFLSPYDSFSGSGQEVFPLVGLANFYVTGYGRVNGSGQLEGGGPEDPCSDGSNGDPYDGTGNEPPPDLNAWGGSTGGTVVWGHFLKVVVQSSTTTGGNGVACDPDELQPCVAALVE